MLVLGEVLWDRLPDATRLGGAALNFAVHLKRLGHAPRLVSAVGADPAGEEARRAIMALGLDTAWLQSTDRFETGRATVRIGPGDETAFTIERPAAYDAVELTDVGLRQMVQWDPAWLYYGTLFPSCSRAKHVWSRLLDTVPNATRFYDLNLRPGFESPDLVDELLRAADVVKLNERELAFVHERLDLPADPEGFCRRGAERYQWQAACVTFGARGCGMVLGDDYTTAPGLRVDVADPVGAGDGFAAAFVHGIVSQWPLEEVAAFSNRLGACVAGVRGAIPDWAGR